VSSKSTRFVSAAAALALIAGCHGSPPRRPAPASSSPSASSPAPSGAAAPAAAGASAPAPGAGGKAAPGAGAVGAGSRAQATAPPAAPVPERAAQQYAQALNMMKSGRNSDAELEFKQLALAYPNYAGPYVNLGLLYGRGSRFGDAEAAFEAALKRNPDDAVANDELGIVLRKLGKFSQAEAAYQRTISLQPDYAPAYFNLGVLYDLYLDEPKKALEQFEHYLTLAGDNKQVAGWVIELRKRVGAPAPAAKKEPA
jgi:tetratricopeptide (TPR) repeat protein